MLSENFEHRLRSVDWKRYKQGSCYGSIADNLLGMMSVDTSAGEGYHSRMEAQLLPQGHLVEAAFYAVPFLVEVIAAEKVQEAIYALLNPMTMCSRSDAFDEGIEVEGVACSLTEMCREEIGRGLRFYLRDVRNTALSRICRLDVISVVCELPEWRATWLPFIEKAHEEEGDPEIRDHLGEWLLDE
jgi:hypothetical protein